MACGYAAEELRKFARFKWLVDWQTSWNSNGTAIAGKALVSVEGLDTT